MVVVFAHSVQESQHQQVRIVSKVGQTSWREGYCFTELDSFRVYGGYKCLVSEKSLETRSLSPNVKVTGI